MADEKEQPTPSNPAPTGVAGPAQTTQFVAEPAGMVEAPPRPEGSDTNPVLLTPPLAARGADIPVCLVGEADKNVCPTDAGSTPLVPGYEILSELGRGGMGVVYKARQVRLNRVVALKMILSGGHASADDLVRFRGEAEAVASLQHPHIVQIHEVGEAEGRPYFSLEFCPGGSLSDKLDGTPWPPGEAAALVATLARAVHAAHQAGIVHRDLKPANVLFAADGSPRLTDFGLAKKMHVDSGPTRSGDIMGTPSYMAPEQAAGNPHAIGPATDVYALGAILYELLTGRPPFKAATPLETVLQVIKEDLVPPRKLQPRLPRDLETLCLQCLRKEPSKRPASAQALADDLQHFLDGEPILARRPSLPERTLLWARKRPTTSALLGVAVLVVLAVLLAVWQAGKNQQANRARELVHSLVTADIAEVPRLLDEFAPSLPLAEPRLQGLLRDRNTDQAERLRLSLALLDSDPGQVEYLSRRLLDCSIREFLLVRDRLGPFRDRLVEPLVQVLRDPSQPPPARFHAGLALVRYAGEEFEWTPADTKFLAAQLLEASRDDQRDVRACLRPLTAQLLGPLQDTFHDEQARTTARLAAADALADLGQADAALLARLAAEATPEQYDVLRTRLLAHPGRDEATQALRSLLGEQPAAGLDVPQRLRLGRRRAGAAITLLHLGELESVGTLFQSADDPEALTQFVHRTRERLLPVSTLLACLEQAPGTPARFGLLLTLGDYPLEELSDAERDRWLPLLLNWYRDDPQAAIHSASGWLLRRWGRQRETAPVDATPVAYDPTGKRDWFVERVGGVPFTFIVFRPGSYRMGSLEQEPYRHRNEGRHRVTISRPFALSDCEVTGGQFASFGRLVGLPPPDAEEPPPPADHPVARLNYAEAVLYCRWLTEASGQQQCYDDPAPGKGSLAEKLDSARKNLLRDCVLHTDRLGFRLPTEAEWEYACRAGTTTAYSFGNDRDLLKHYGCHLEQGSRPAGSLRPNPHGLFDMHGNVWEWCHDWYEGPLPDGAVDPVGPATGQYRVLRGGGWDRSPWHCRSAYRHSPTPNYRASYMGFRLARTLPPS